MTENTFLCELSLSIVQVKSEEENIGKRLRSCQTVHSPFSSFLSPSIPPSLHFPCPPSYTLGTLIQKSAYVLRASGAGTVQTRRRVISHCFEQIAASDDGNLIPTVFEDGGVRRGGTVTEAAAVLWHDSACACVVPLMQTHFHTRPHTSREGAS